METIKKTSLEPEVNPSIVEELRTHREAVERAHRIRELAAVGNRNQENKVSTVDGAKLRAPLCAIILVLLILGLFAVIGYLIIKLNEARANQLELEVLKLVLNLIADNQQEESLVKDC